MFYNLKVKKFEEILFHLLKKCKLLRFFKVYSEGGVLEFFRGI